MRLRTKRNARWHVLATLLTFVLPMTPLQADIGTTSNKQSLIEDSQPAPTNAFVDTATIWTTDNGLSENALLLLSHMQLAESEGLNTERYHLGTLSALAEEQWHAGLRQPFDELMATAFKQLVSDLGQGMIAPDKAQSAWFQAIPDVDANSAYLALKIPGNTVETVLNQYRPQHATYLKLAQKLDDYRAIQAMGGWPRVPISKTLKPGMSKPSIATLRQRLEITGELKPTVYEENRTRYTHDLVKAVKEFQRNHGLVADGFIGKNTFTALNVPVESRIDTLRSNLERLRWMPRDLGARHVITNIADFQLSVVDHDREILTMPVVVGKEKYKTPVFSDEIEWVELNPTWTVPKSILYRELLPRERKDPGYLQRNNFELIREEKGAIVIREPNSLTPEELNAHPFRYTLRQKTGKRNALGGTKFIFPNKYSIYLHDTPSKHLFSRNTRAYSHGCVRVGNPETLAETLLGFQGYTPRKIAKLRNNGKATRLLLDEHIPMHITYLTSWVDDTGTLQFRNDIYGHDSGLILALEEPHKVIWPASILAILEER